LKRVLRASLCTALFFAAGSLPAGTGGSDSQLDKLLHALGFGLLAWLWCAALVELRPRRATLELAAAGFALSSAFGGLLELWQGMLGYRSRELYDFVADVAGALVAAGLWAAFRARGRGPATSA
jgi:VanZ family protein